MYSVIHLGVSGTPHADFRTHKDITNSVDNPSNDSPGSDGEDEASGARIPVPPPEGALMTFANHSANLLNLYQVENHPLCKHGHARRANMQMGCSAQNHSYT
jgi:hypothetical protein